MFQGCTSLQKAPVLPAAKVADGAYYRLFYGCTFLNYVKCLATDIGEEWAVEEWVGNVSSTGTFVKTYGMTSWQTGDSGIPKATGSSCSIAALSAIRTPSTPACPTPASSSRIAISAEPPTLFSDLQRLGLRIAQSRVSPTPTLPRHPPQATNPTDMCSTTAGSSPPLVWTTSILADHGVIMATPSS